MAEAGTTQMQLWIEGLSAGDASCQALLIRHACERLRILTRRMLHRDYTRLRALEQTDDVLQNALMRLHRALQDPNVKPASVADFFRLGTLQIRRELLDLARHHFGPGRPPVVAAATVQDDTEAPTPEAAAAETWAPDRLLAWGEFHRQVEALPDAERAVFELLWYQELTQVEAAAVLKVSVPTIKRRWLSARLLLQSALPLAESSA